MQIILKRYDGIYLLLPLGIKNLSLKDFMIPHKKGCCGFEASSKRYER